ncbi:Collagen triple helix repeat protein [Balamuthia mandrillaris]
MVTLAWRSLLFLLLVLRLLAVTEGQPIAQSYRFQADLGMPDPNSYTIFGDVDGDDYPELLFSSTDTNNFTLVFTRGVEVKRTEPVLLPPGGAPLFMTSLGDINKDGRPDLFIRSDASRFAVGLLRASEFAFDWIDFMYNVTPSAGPVLALQPCIPSYDVLPIVLALSTEHTQPLSLPFLSFVGFTLHTDGSIAQVTELIPSLGQLDFYVFVPGACTSASHYPDALIKTEHGDVFALSLELGDDGQIQVTNTLNSTRAFPEKYYFIQNARDYDHDGGTDFLFCLREADEDPSLSCDMLLMERQSYTPHSITRIYFADILYNGTGSLKSDPISMGTIPQPEGSLYPSVTALILHKAPLYRWKEECLRPFKPTTHSFVFFLSPPPTTTRRSWIYLSSSIHLDDALFQTSTLTWTTATVFSTSIGQHAMLDALGLETSISLDATPSLSLYTYHSAKWLHHPSLVDSYNLGLDDVKLSFFMRWSRVLEDNELVSVGASFGVLFQGVDLDVEEGELIGEDDRNGTVRRYVFGKENADGSGGMVKVGMATKAQVDDGRMENVEQTAFVIKLNDATTRLEVQLNLPAFTYTLLYDPDFTVLFGEGGGDGEDGEDGEDGYDGDDPKDENDDDDDY